MSWGFVLTGQTHQDTDRYGRIEVVTPDNRLALTGELVRRTETRLLVLSGVARVQLYVPADCEGGQVHTPLPAVDMRITVDAASGDQATWILQLPWDVAAEYPLAIVTAAPIAGWPR